MLDAIVQLAVDETGVSEPPVTPMEGSRFIVGPDASDEWEGKENQIAVRVDGAWMFFVPGSGWLAWDKTRELLVVYSDANWVDVSAAPESLPFLGINGLADPNERFLVNSQSALFNHDGDSHRLKLNKAGPADTASLIFQSGFEGRAELGLPGTDDFGIKVSPDGTVWHDAMAVDGQTGAVSFPSSGVELEGSLFSNLLPDSGRFNDPTNQNQLADNTAVQPAYMTAYNGSVITFPARFIHNNSTYGGVAEALDPIVDELVLKIFGSVGQRYGAEFHVMHIAAGTGTVSPITVDGQTFYRQSIISANPRPRRYTSGFFCTRCKRQRGTPPAIRFG